jgi:hypothetical protein
MLLSFSAMTDSCVVMLYGHASSFAGGIIFGQINHPSGPVYYPNADSHTSGLEPIYSKVTRAKSQEVSQIR